MNSQPFLAAFYCREGRGFMWTGFVKAVVQIFVLCSLAAKGWVQTTSPFKVPLACYKRLIQFWLCYGPPARFAGCVRCSSAPLHSLGQRQSHDRAMLQGWKSSCTRKRFGRESGYKKDTFGISSHCYDSVYTSSYLKHPYAPWEGRIKPQASRWLFTQWGSSLLQALHHMICSYCRKRKF